MRLQPESRFTQPTELCPHPGYWSSADPDSTEAEVSEMVGGLVRGLQPGYCIETGSAWGQTTEAIGRALVRNGRGVLHSMETEPGRVAATMLRTEGLPVEVFPISSLDFLPEHTIDFAFFDSLFELRVSEFKHFRKWMRVGTIVAFHDTRPGHGRSQIESGHDLRTEIETELSDLIRFIHLPTPRGITFGEVI